MKGMRYSLNSIISILYIGKILILLNIHSLGFRGITFVYLLLEIV